ncbi:MAG: TlpA disulfide reductase family protein [Acidobacteriota bacterium]
MKLKIIFLILILSTSNLFLYSQETDNSNKIKLYNDLSNAEISPINQKNVIKLKDVKNKVIVVVFFAAWCNPCTQQVKNLIEIKTEFQKEDLFIIGLDADEEDKTDFDRFLGKKVAKNSTIRGSSSDSKDFWKFLKKNKINYPLGFVKESLFQSLYQVSKRDAIPQTIIIQDGEIKEIYVGGGKTFKRFTDKLKEIFNKN